MVAKSKKRKKRIAIINKSDRIEMGIKELYSAYVATEGASIHPIQEPSSKPSSPLEREIQEMQKRAENGTLLTLPLSDLVMMQMVGDFKGFLESLSEKESSSEYEPQPEYQKDPLQMIKETKREVTTYRLFPNIVKKTIEAQFGEKHAALRELGQNGIDAYEPVDSERRILFDLTEEEQHHVLRVRDYGVGMDLKSVVRDLLIPYNSGKEFDPTKIGEHGIGWYSIVDLAEVVKVVTRKRGGNRFTQALIYREDDIWKTTLLSDSIGGFHPQLNTEAAGTEVCAYIPRGETSEDDIQEYIYQYLGMVDPQKASITLTGEPINNLRENYLQAAPAEVVIENTNKPLRLGVSKRILSGHRTLNPASHNHRDKNLEKAIYTQRGLFIKYDNFPFDNQSIHSQLARGMISGGLDFWIDVPENVTLTKGRNNIIADHGPAVLEGTYQAFEDLFIDVVLNDEEILHHPEGNLLESIAYIFDRGHAQGTALILERNKYDFKKRFVARAAFLGSGAIDLGALCLEYALRACKRTGQFFGEVWERRNHKTEGENGEKETEKKEPWSLAEIVKSAYEAFCDFAPSAAKAVWNVSKIAVPGIVLTVGAVYGGYKLYEAYGSAPFRYAGLGLLGTAALAGAGYAGYKTYKSWPEIVQTMKAWGQTKSVGTAITPFSPISKDKFSLVEFFSGMYLGAMHQLGLYLDVEEKRKKKREKKIAKISQKYVSDMQKDEFLRRILKKQIIPAEFYRLKENEREEETKTGSQETPRCTSLLDRLIKMADSIAPIDPPAQLPERNPYQPRFSNWIKPKSNLEKIETKISIDELVRIYLEGNLKHDKNIRPDRFLPGEYFVKYGHPIVHTVVDRLEIMASNVEAKYDVKVLEDYLDNIGAAMGGLALTAYFFSGLGMIHLFAGELSRGIIKNPFEGTSLYRRTKRTIQATGDWCRKNGVAEEIKGGLIALIKSPVTLPCWAAKNGAPWVYEHALAPLGESLHPRKYPEYAAQFRSWKQKRAEKNEQQKKIKTEERERRNRLIAEERKRREEQKAQSTEQTRQKGLIERLRGGISDWYYSSLVYGWFGYGTTGLADSFSLSSSKVRYIADTLNVGRSYAHFVDAVERLDQIVSAALGEKPHEIELHFERNPSTEIGFAAGHDEGFVIAPKRRLILSLNGRLRQNYLDYRLGGFMRTGTSKTTGEAITKREIIEELLRERLRKRFPENAAEFDYRIFDALIHAWAHRDLEQIYGYTGRDRYTHALLHEHHAGFYSTKDRLRRMVVDYLIKEKIDLSAEVNKVLPKPEEIDLNDKYYSIVPESFLSFTTMTRRRLRYERLIYDEFRAEDKEKESLKNKEAKEGEEKEAKNLYK